jgi:hypothetical protein
VKHSFFFLHLEKENCPPGTILGPKARCRRRSLFDTSVAGESTGRQRGKLARANATSESAGIAYACRAEGPSPSVAKRPLTLPCESLQASLPVVDNNQKVVGAPLPVVGEKFSKIWPKFAKFSKIFEQKIELCSIFRKMLHFGKIPKNFGQN